MADQAGVTPASPRRADARRNYDHLLDTARVVVAEQGAQASLRDIARRAGVGLATLYRHFPTREALLETLLHDGFLSLVDEAANLAATEPPDRALALWLHRLAAGAATYHGLPGPMVAALNDPESALWRSCAAVHDAGARLLDTAQQRGGIRPDVTGADLFALVGGLTWVADQTPALADRRQHLLDVLIDGLAR